MIVLVLFLGGCEEAGITVDEVSNPGGAPEKIYFPRQPEMRDSDDADISGTLELIDGCLRITNPRGVDGLVVWPHDFRAHVEGGVVQVVDGRSQIVARVGDTVMLGGSGTPGSENKKLGPCKGAYWNASDDVTVLSSE